MWIRGTGWDEEIPTDIMQSWKGISSQLKLIEKIEIPRWIFTSNKSVEIHGFCDGSLQAYAAVLYVRSKDHEGNFILNLLTSKTKVTPIKTISLPRIELCGALLLARLFKTVQRALKFDHIIFHAWTDSEIVLSWLRGHPNKYKMFVANRISEIQEICSSNVWSHVRSESNPADCATRGLLPKDLLTFEMWWNGPNWLKQPKELWPATSVVEECDLEAKTLKVNTMITKNPSNLELLITRCSSLTKLIRITAYCFRFMNSYIKREKTPESKYLTTTELKFSLKFWIKTAQNEQFGKEIHELETKNSITGRLQNLNPFLDQEGILRVGGRLQNANISWNEKHPIILENNHLITKLLVDLVHKNTLHGGVQLMTAVLRQNYWVLNARSVLKQTVFKCTICFRQKAEYRQQLMGNLPKSRVQASRVFDHVGVDYCGPLEIKTSKLKNAKMTKAYLSIFICLVTRAIHIEVVSELTTQAFIAALKRFVGRRGLQHLF